MKNRLLRILLVCCMVLALLPASALAEEPTGSGETIIGLTQDNISSYMELASGSYQLTEDITISSSLSISGTVTLDLNDHVLKMTDSVIDASVIEVKSGGSLTLTDRAENKTAKYFRKEASGLWKLLTDGRTSENIVTGGVITGGSTGLGGGVRIRAGGTLIMNGGNIVGCRANGQGGGVYVSGGGTFTMNGGTIAGCVANSDDSGTQGGGVCVENGREEDKDNNKTELARGIFTMNDGSIIGCATESGKGGSVYIMNSVSGSDYYGLFTMNGGSISDSGVSDDETCETIRNIGTFIANGGTVTNSGSGQYSCALFTSGIFKTEQGFPGTEFFGAAHIGHYIDLFDGGVFKDGSTVINDSTITGGMFCGTVTNRSGGVIAGGVFNGTVTNLNGGKITGGTFHAGVFGAGHITGSGTAEDPYQIVTAQGLKAFRDIVNGANGAAQNPAACAVLTADIDLNNEKWTPIAYSDHFDENTTLYYSGHFDGQGHTIRGLYVSVLSGSSDEQVCLGLFSAVKNAVIQNVTVAGSVAGFNGNMGGIAGYLSNSTIKNCANHCTVKSTTAPEPASYVGGIAGAMVANSTIRDCYNTGTVTEDQSSEYHCTGGIVGYSGGSTVSNCYNVGEVAGNGGRSGEIVGLNDNEAAPSTVSNCYYLSDTSSGEARTQTEFADGTVLTALIHDRADGDHPWAAECKYLAAAGKTLPVFRGQGDDHTHAWSQWVQVENTETHSRSCSCGAVQTVNCNGGEATCLVKAQCRDCGQPYGETNPNNHTGTAQWTATAAVHQKKWSCCGSAFTPEEAHHWENGICRDCGYGCLHEDLAHSPAKAATASAEGSIEYWYCASCGKYFADKNAQQEITQAETVIPRRQYPVGAPSYPITVPDAPNGTVTVSPKSAAKGSTVIITVEPDEGYELDKITVTDKDGNELQLTDKGDGKYSFVMPSGKVDIDATFKKLTETSPFDDVSTDAYYYEAVKWAAENGVTGGVGGGLFAPELTCSRGQIVTFLWRAAGSPEPKALSSFTDVAADAYYAKAVAWAVENGVTTGTGDNRFSPDDPCTRGQAVTFLWRALGQLTGDKATFSDVPADSYFAQAVAWAAANGVTTGTGNGRFSPDADCTRAQIVTFLWRSAK